jgi:Yip1 domain
MTQGFYQQPNTNGEAPREEAFQVRPSGGVPPHPLREALWQLPRQYLRVLRKASKRTFAEEMGKASWALVWVQLLGLTVINITVTWVFNLLPSLHALGLTNLGGGGPQWLQNLSTVLSHPLGQLPLTPLSFFIISAILYLLARAVGGQGTFLAQSYTTLLFSVPLTLLFSVLALVLGVIPFAGLILVLVVFFALAIYQLILQTQTIMAVHALSGGKATGGGVLTVLAVILISIVPGGSLLVGSWP